jgi:uncharacterized cupin superfamily protein
MPDEQIATSRLLSGDVHVETVAPDGVSESLATASRTLFDGAFELGLWEAGPGSDTDVEVDELFLVLAGAGTVTFADGSTIELRPGVLVRLRQGDETTWEITERLRKVYLT